jgi:hypothetical protein
MLPDDPVNIRAIGESHGIGEGTFHAVVPSGQRAVAEARRRGGRGSPRRLTSNSGSCG